MATDQAFWRSNLQVWLASNRTKSGSLIAANPPWKIVFPFTVWNIWKSRNRLVFNRKNRSPKLAAEIVNQAFEFLHCVASPRVQVGKVVKRMCWVRPPLGWKKLKTDGAFNGDAGLVGCGGIVRDERGHWVNGFSKRIGLTNSFEAELWGLREGLLLCCNLNISHLVIELDAKAIVNVLGNLSYVNHVISPILDDCRMLVSRFQHIWIKHCYREVNKCADSLVRLSFTQDADFSSFLSPSVDIFDVFEDDLNGIYFDRLCPEPFVFS